MSSELIVALAAAGSSIITGVATWYGTLRFHKIKRGQEENKAIQLAQQIRDTQMKELAKLHTMVIEDRDAFTALDAEFEKLKRQIIIKDAVIESLKMDIEQYRTEAHEKDEQITELTNRVNQLEKAMK